MKTSAQIVLILSFAVAGCAQNHTASTTPRPDYFRKYVTYTGSNIPQPKDRVTFGPERANTPSQSAARNTPSLYPTDPVVGANAGPNDTGDTGPYQDVGAGPAGSAPMPGTH